MRKHLPFLVIVGLILAVTLWSVGGGGGAYPPIFESEQTYEEAASRAAQEGKLFIAHATASWCGPCRQMNRTTFIDPTFIEWAEENAILFAVDVDRMQRIARELGISGIPTAVVFRDGVEVARLPGYRSASEFIAAIDPHVPRESSTYESESNYEA